VTLYNPHLLPRHDLVETFVARQPLLDDLVDDLRRGGGQHHLLVGGRGSGKTTLLLRLAVTIEDDKTLARKCIPLRFPEEQYNVARPSDFWMNAIDALVDALERQDERRAAKRLESALAELEHLDEAERARRSLALLESWARQATRLVVLLVDNLDLVLERLAADLWGLREALSIDNHLVVIGASSKLIDEAIDYQSPFYDFFHVHELGPLSEAEARHLVRSLARRAKTPRVEEVLEQDPGRFKALYVLTGGTPRTLALLHTVLALDHSDRIERDLDGLLDQLTPYYKARFDDLPAQSQVIVDKVALHWHPITAAECQLATRLDLNTVSAQLTRLVKSGLLAKVSLPGSAKLGFQISERFFNIWYLMRASRRLRRRLSWFVEFLRIFYGEEDLRRRADALVSAQPPDRLDSPAKFLAFASAISDEALRRRLEFRAIVLVMEHEITAIREVMDLEGEDVHLAPIIDRVRALREIRARIAKAKVQWPAGQTSKSAAEVISRHPILSLHHKESIVHLIEAGKPPNLVDGFDIAPWYSILGVRLVDTIGSGELPALADITTATEIQQIIALAKPGWEAIAEVATAKELFGSPLDGEMLRLIRLMPDGASGLIFAASLVLEGNNWTRARYLVSLAIRKTSTDMDMEDVAMLVAFLRTCIRKGRAKEAAELLAEAGMTERWAPLYEAVCAIAEGSSVRLDSLAPEMRVAALELFEQLRKPEGSQIPDDSIEATRSSEPPMTNLHAASSHKPRKHKRSKTLRSRAGSNPVQISAPRRMK